MSATKRYCDPYNAGLASETKAVQRRIARLLESLSVEINENIASGAIVEDVRRFRLELWEKLTKDGWRLTYGPTGSKPRVKAPKGV